MSGEVVGNARDQRRLRAWNEEVERVLRGVPDQGGEVIRRQRWDVVAFRDTEMNRVNWVFARTVPAVSYLETTLYLPDCSSVSRHDVDGLDTVTLGELPCEGMLAPATANQQYPQLQIRLGRRHVEEATLMRAEVRRQREGGRCKR